MADLNSHATSATNSRKSYGLVEVSGLHYSEVRLPRKNREQRRKDIPYFMPQRAPASRVADEPSRFDVVEICTEKSDTSLAIPEKKRSNSP
ncbi:MAG: hypothetical protein ABI748_03355 [Dokdonella sp.]